MFVVAEATFPLAFDQYATGEACHSKPVQETGRLACAWRDAEHAYRSAQIGDSTAAEAMTFMWSFLRQGQGMLSGTASNYDLNKMYTGIAIAIAGAALAIASIVISDMKPGLGSVAYGTSLLAYGATMFASSYVEEEQQFWHWAVGGWLMVLHCKE